MKRILSLLIVSFFLLSFVSAGELKDSFIEEVQKIEKPEITQEECSSLLYKIVISVLRGFSFEIDSDEHFYLVINEKDCVWSFDIVDEIEGEADITVIGIKEVGGEPLDVQVNTLRGRILGKWLKEDWAE